MEGLDKIFSSAPGLLEPYLMEDLPEKNFIVIEQRRKWSDVKSTENNAWKRFNEVDNILALLSGPQFEYNGEKNQKLSQTTPNIKTTLAEFQEIKRRDCLSFSKLTATKATSGNLYKKFVHKTSSEAPDDFKRKTLIKSLINLENVLELIEGREETTQEQEKDFPIVQTKRNSQELSAVHNKAISLFKSKPVEGINYLIEEKVIENNPVDIGNFLFNFDRFDKVQLGEYLSRSLVVNENEVDENATKILDQYISNFNFDHQDFDLSLRSFLYRFQLPGEAQKIDRLMKIFASKYFQSHKDDKLFKNELYVYAIAFGTIMLNTDLYNDHVRNKMTVRQFVDNIHHFNVNAPPATDIPVDFLEDIYFKISVDEIKREQNIFSSALKRGIVFIYTKTSVSHCWKRRWLVLCDLSLYIFRKPNDERLISKISLANSSVSVVGNEKGRQFCLWLHIPKATNDQILLNYHQKIGEKEDQKYHILLSTSYTFEIPLWARAMEHCILHSVPFA